MLFVVFLTLITSFGYTLWLLIEFPGMSVIVSPADESSKEKEVREVMKEECELVVVKS